MKNAVRSWVRTWRDTWDLGRQMSHLSVQTKLETVSSSLQCSVVADIRAKNCFPLHVGYFTVPLKYVVRVLLRARIKFVWQFLGRTHLSSVLTFTGVANEACRQAGGCDAFMLSTSFINGLSSKKNLGCHSFPFDPTSEFRLAVLLSVMHAAPFRRSVYAFPPCSGY
jgi:hypothetical protein